MSEDERTVKTAHLKPDCSNGPYEAGVKKASSPRRRRLSVDPLSRPNVSGSESSGAHTPLLPETSPASFPVECCTSSSPRCSATPDDFVRVIEMVDGERIRHHEVERHPDVVTKLEERYIFFRRRVPDHIQDWGSNARSNSRSPYLRW